MDLTYDDILKKVEEVLDEVDNIRYKNENQDKPARLPENKFTNMVCMRLNSILRKQIVMTQSEALAAYNNRILLHEKICEILDLIDYINSRGVIYIIDKQTVCAYLRINVETYQFFLKDYSIDEEIRMEFTSVEEMLVSTLQQGAESDLRVTGAVLNRLRMKGEYGGNEIEFHRRADNRGVIEGQIDEVELNKKLTTVYDFTKLLCSQKEKK